MNDLENKAKDIDLFEKMKPKDISLERARVNDIFKLKRDPKELDSSNFGMSRAYHDTIRTNNIKEGSSTAAPHNNFAGQGSLKYNFNYDALSKWQPNKSYCDAIIEISKDVAGTQLTYEDDLAPAMGFLSNLFSDMSYRVEDNEISRLNQHIPQIDMIEKRMQKGGDWMNNIGAISNFYQSSFYERQNQVCSDSGNNLLEKKPEEYYQAETLTQAQLFTNIDIAADTVSWTRATKTISYVDTAANNLRTLIDVNDVVQFTFNGISLLCRIRNKTGFGGGNGTFIVDRDFGADVGAGLINVVLPNPILYKLRPRETLVSTYNTTAEVFPNVTVANDTVQWVQQSRTIIVRDDPTANVESINLRCLLKTGDYLRCVFNALTLTCKVESILYNVSTRANAAANAFIQKGEYMISVDQNFGADVDQGAINAGDPIFMLYSYGRNVIETNINRNVKIMKLQWTPPLSIFRQNKALPANFKNTLELFVNTNLYKTSCVESKYSSKTDVDHGGTDYKIRLLDFVFRPYKITGGDRISDDTYYLDLDEIQCQKKPILSSSSEINLDVQPSCMGLCIAMQDISAGSNTLYSASKFKIRDNEELNLTSYHINYAGYQLPTPDPIIDYTTLNVDKISDLWYKDQIYNGAINKDSQESLSEWIERGIYLYHPFPKSGEDRSTNVNIDLNFSALTDNVSNLLLFSFYKKVAILRIENSKLIEVRTENS
jgi:hypothetical protein